MKQLFVIALCICILFGILTSCDSEINSTKPTGESKSTEDLSPIGGSQHCEVHYEQYHQILSELTDSLDPQEITNWSEKVIAEYEGTDCFERGINIKSFIDYFQIPREAFEEYCNGRWSTVHNIDLLYSDDIEAIEAYYRDLEPRTATMIKQERYRNVKRFVLDNHIDIQEIWGKEDAEKTEIEKEVEYYDKVSMFRLIQLFEVERPELEDAIERANQWIKSEYSYDYQFDLIYNEDGTLKDFEIAPNKTVVELDAEFAGVENFFTD